MITSAKKMLSDIHDRGIRMRADGNDLVLKPAGLVSAELVEQVTPIKSELLALLRLSNSPSDGGQTNGTMPAELQPGFPSADDWIKGRNISLETVDFDRYQYGGRPHTLRPELQQKWLDTYVEAMQVVPEPAAWREAWLAVKNRTNRDHFTRARSIHSARLRMTPSESSVGMQKEYLTDGKDSDTLAHMAKIIDELRRAIAESDLSRYRIAQESGISESALSRLMSGERGLGMDSAERLADYLGLEISIRQKRKRKQKGR